MSCICPVLHPPPPPTSCLSSLPLLPTCSSVTFELDGEPAAFDLFYENVIKTNGGHMFDVIVTFQVRQGGCWWGVCLGVCVCAGCEGDSCGKGPAQGSTQVAIIRLQAGPPRFLPYRALLSASP